MWIWKSDIEYWLNSAEREMKHLPEDSKDKIYLKGKAWVLIRLLQKKSPV